MLVDVDCEERERLTVVYLNACARTIEVCKIVGNFGTAEWREATKDARAECEAALVALNNHKRDHECLALTES
jgi:hypothetical protein